MRDPNVVSDLKVDTDSKMLAQSRRLLDSQFSCTFNETMAECFIHFKQHSEDEDIGWRWTLMMNNDTLHHGSQS